VCVEIQGRNLRNSAAALREFHGVVSVEPAGSALHLFYEPSATTLDMLREEAGRRGLAVAAAEIQPSLEDVFIALIRSAPAVAAGKETS
jgi:hypothetical protein